MRPAPEEMFTIRPQRRSFIAGTTARVHRNVLVRFASTTCRQSWSVTSSSGRPTCPQTPPALLTRMSTGAGRREELPDGIGAGQVRDVLVDAVHGGALGRKRRFDRGPDAVRGAGHDRRPARQVTHFTKYQFSGVMLSVGLCGRTPLRLLTTSVRV